MSKCPSWYKIENTLNMQLAMRPVVIEVRKGDLFTAYSSIYNFPLIDLLGLMSFETIVQFISITGDTYEIDQPIHTFWLNVEIGDLISIVDNLQGKYYHIHMVMEDHWQINSNFEDELHMDIQDRSFLDVLIKGILKSKKVRPPRIFGNYYCCEIHEGSMSHFSTMNNYLKQSATNMIKVK